jgi:RNA polymerase sigma-70 factor (ECF subfamily)
MLEARRDFTTFRGASPGEFEAWLLTILERNVQNKIREYLGTQGRDVGREVPGSSGPFRWLEDQGDSPSAIASRNEEEELRRRAVARLGPEEQEVIRLRHHENLSWDEVARSMGRTSAGAARKLWSRTVEKLPELIEQVKRERRGET